MNRVENQIFNENNKPPITIEGDGGAFRIISPKIELASNLESLRFAITVNKLPTRLELGQRIHGIVIDNESPKLIDMRHKAASLQSLPKKDRILPLMDLVSQEIKYPFPSTLEQINKTDPEKGKRIQEYTRNSHIPVTLSEIVDNGYGICRHFSLTALSLAIDAGLSGVHLKHEGSRDDDQAKLLNVIRGDTGLPLFQSFGINERFDGGHSWIEILLDDGEWIPIDPTTGLTGLTPEGLETFRDANYKGILESSINDSGLPNKVYSRAQIFILPGDKSAAG
jgi:hypothetical protein